MSCCTCCTICCYFTRRYFLARAFLVKVPLYGIITQYSSTAYMYMYIGIAMVGWSSIITIHKVTSVFTFSFNLNRTSRWRTCKKVTACKNTGKHDFHRFFIIIFFIFVLHNSITQYGSTVYRTVYIGIANGWSSIIAIYNSFYFQSICLLRTSK